MPAIVGPLQILSVGGGVVHFGDTAFISPKDTAKTYTGAGTINTGALIVTNSGISANTTFDSKLVDQPIVGNN